jgi:hypothetical protein
MLSLRVVGGVYIFYTLTTTFLPFSPPTREEISLSKPLPLCFVLLCLSLPQEWTVNGRLQTGCGR